MLQKSVQEAEEVAQFYDFIEIHPPEVYIGLIERDIVQNEAQILDVLNNLTKLGERLNKPVVATGNVHHLEEHEKLYRKILIARSEERRVGKEWKGKR